jgi:hypothetical protein
MQDVLLDKFESLKKQRRLEQTSEVAQLRDPSGTLLLDPDWDWLTSGHNDQELDIDGEWWYGPQDYASGDVDSPSCS